MQLKERKERIIWWYIADCTICGNPKAHITVQFNSGGQQTICKACARYMAELYKTKPYDKVSV